MAAMHGHRSVVEALLDFNKTHKSAAAAAAAAPADGTASTPAVSAATSTAAAAGGAAGGASSAAPPAAATAAAAGVTAPNGAMSTEAAAAEHIVDINAQDANGNTPLILACMFAHEPVVSLLLERCAKAGIASHSGHPALYYACANGGCERVVELLLTKVRPGTGFALQGLAFALVLGERSLATRWIPAVM